MTSRTLVYFVFLLAGAVIGAIARGAIGGGDKVAEPVDDAVSAISEFRRPDAGDDRAIIDMLESLSLALNRESEYRQSLEDQIIELEARLDDLQASIGESGSAASQRAVKARAESRRGGQPLTVAKLVDAGLDQRDAEAIKRRVDDLSMQRLYLRDQAMREGWLGEERYRSESRRIASEQANLQNEFGDENYDRYLYASGRSNRVQIQSVIENSPAYSAGMQTGDRILSYNGQRTYSPSDLRRASMQGSAGEMIALQVDRNGRRLDLYIPRGPLGIQMTGVSEKP